jgi:hypothetical protein
MMCPRCADKLQNVIEFFQDGENFEYTREYYCTNCKSSVIEHFDEQGLKASEWIDFNV